MAEVAQILVALAEPTRLRVLEQLRAGPRSVGELTAAVPESQSAVSQHLRAQHPSYGPCAFGARRSGRLTAAE